MAEERRGGGRPAQSSGRARTSGGAASGKPRSGGKPVGRSAGGKPAGKTSGKPGAGKSFGERGAGKSFGERGRSAAGGAPRDGGRGFSRDESRDDRRSNGARRGGPKGRDEWSGGTSGSKPAGKSGYGKSSYGQDAKGGGKGPARSGSGSSKGGSERRGTGGRFERRPVEREERTADQVAYDGPDLPDEITGKELDRSVAAHLKGLPDKLAARIARHLAAAGMYIDDDPELAYQHAKAAKSRAQRIAVIREALGEAAYAAGHYAEALSELRAAKRMNGATAYLPIMADCHRALGHPEQAIKLAHSPSVVNFKPEAKAEMTLVEAGARRDMGQLDAALRVLELSPLTNKSRASWVVRLRYAYADTLEAAGRLTEALTWFHRTHAIDADELTDAAARAEDLERRVDRTED
jgi:hypothetical protein